MKRLLKVPQASINTDFLHFKLFKLIFSGTQDKPHQLHFNPSESIITVTQMLRRHIFMKLKTKQITITAILLAICIVSQFFKNLNVYITGPIINAALILTTVYAELACGIILSVITPITSFFITGSPIMAAIPAMFPCIMIGNIILVLVVALLRDKFGKKTGLPVSLVIGAACKALFMGILISLIILPNMLPVKMQPMLHVLQIQFSVTQLITALIGGVYALIILAVLRNTSLGEQV